MNIKLTKKNQQQLRKLGVLAVYLFGSRAQGTAGPLSDYDFAFLMKKGGHKRGGVVYDALYDILSPYCPRTLENDVIDIVFLNDVNLELREHVIRYGKVLFDDDPTARMNFEARTTLEYCDFRPILDMFDRTIIESL